LPNPCYGQVWVNKIKIIKMKIKVKTSLIKIKVTDFTHYEGGYERHKLPTLQEAVKCVIEEAIKLHNQVKENINENS
jgi:hypothetical protein